MDASKHRVFYYHADASPFGGFLTDPVEKILPSHASSALAPAGGHATSSMGPFSMNGVASCRSASSEIFGGVNTTTDAWRTEVISTIEGLDVGDGRVTAEQIVAHLTVEHPREDPSSRFPKVSFKGSFFKDLRVNGHLIDPALNLDLQTLPKQAAALPFKQRFPENAFIEDKTLLERARGQYKGMIATAGDLDWVEKRYGWVIDEKLPGKGFVTCSLVENLTVTKEQKVEVGRVVEGPPPPVPCGYIVPVADYGNLFLGEVIVEPGLFRLIMLRIELGCPTKGSLGFVTADSNGRPIP